MGERPRADIAIATARPALVDGVRDHPPVLRWQRRDARLAGGRRTADGRNGGVEPELGRPSGERIQRLLDGARRDGRRYRRYFRCAARRIRRPAGRPRRQRAGRERWRRSGRRRRQRQGLGRGRPERHGRIVAVRNVLGRGSVLRELQSSSLLPVVLPGLLHGVEQLGLGRWFWIRIRRCDLSRAVRSRADVLQRHVRRRDRRHPQLRWVRHQLRGRESVLRQWQVRYPALQRRRLSRERVLLRLTMLRRRYAVLRRSRARGDRAHVHGARERNVPGRLSYVSVVGRHPSRPVSDLLRRTASKPS